MADKQTFLFIYRMTADSGLAPCVDKDKDDKKLLTLSCCKGGRKDNTKTGIRYWLGSGQKGNLSFNCETDSVYILGTYKNDFLYLAKIEKAIEMKEYYSNEQYKKRLDIIYDVDGDKLKRNQRLRKENIHTDNDQIKRDIAGTFVLLSQDFIYLGKDRISFSENLLSKMPKNREVKVYTNEDANEIITWCIEKDDNKNHKTTDPLKRSCNQR
ncbi:MAG: hypothetical protein U0L76_02605 [Ruminococcus sp.]|nr:hypothetical protein [Ruminococcus sp.]